jgi:hypothetical protein
MTWGEIQIISLQKMFAKDVPITMEDLEDLRNDDDTKLYLSQMNATANEAIQRIKPYVQNTYEYDEDEKEYVKKTTDVIDTDTTDTTELSYPLEACVLIPLYIASQLYKDDDISIATQYRNEFETGLQNLVLNIENQAKVEEVYY